MQELDKTLTKNPFKNGIANIELSVVVSFINEAEVLPEFIRRLELVLVDLFKNSDERYEIIFVNDASTDDSLQILTNSRKNNPNIKIINMSRRFGHMEGIFAGLKATTGAAVIYLDVDLQDPPELITKLWQRWKGSDDIDVVFTTRKGRLGESQFKLLMTKIGYRILRYLCNFEVPLDSGDYKLLSRRVVNELAQMDEKQPFFRFLVQWVGFKQEQVFYVREARFAGKTKFKFRTTINQFFELSLFPFSETPLRVILVLGIGISFISVVYLVVLVILKIGGYSFGPVSYLMAILTLLGGIQLLFLGVVGLYVGAILRQVNSRPSHIINNTIGFDDPVKNEDE